VVTTSLDSHVAIEIGTWPGSLGFRHTIYEARATRGIVVTLNPDDYRGLAVPVFPL